MSLVLVRKFQTNYIKIIKTAGISNTFSMVLLSQLIPIAIRLRIGIFRGIFYKSWGCRKSQNPLTTEVTKN